MTPDDAGRWTALLVAAEAVDRTGEHYDEADCAVSLTDPGVDPARDTVLVLDGDRPVACQLLYGADPDGSSSVYADGVVHPAHRRRGIGSALLAVARQRAAGLGAELHVRVPETVPGAVALVESAGLVAVRWWWKLHRDLAGPVVRVDLPAGVSLVPLGSGGGYDAARWDEPLHTARNVAFADHFGSDPETAEAFAHWRTAPASFRPDCSAAACTQDGAVVGFLLADEFAAATAQTGHRDLYVATVGTVPEWRGRGVAAALLAHALERARDGGYASSSLHVDAQNPTGALGVYERAGYRPAARQVTYALPAPS
jgi:mycothiol synthase